jgi:hypothetical protein
MCPIVYLTNHSIIVQNVANQVTFGREEFIPIANKSKPTRIPTEHIAARHESYVRPLGIKKIPGFDGLYHITGAFQNPGGGLTMTLYDQTSQINGGGSGVEGNPSAVPEPTTILLLGSGLANLIWRRMRA